MGEGCKIIGGGGGGTLLMKNLENNKRYRDEKFEDLWGIHRIKSKDLCQHSLKFLSVFLI